MTVIVNIGQHVGYFLHGEVSQDVFRIAQIVVLKKLETIKSGSQVR